MRRHNIGLDEATTALVVSRAMERELSIRGNTKNSKNISPSEAIQRLTSKLSLDNILYESGEDDSDDDGQNEVLPLKIPKFRRVSSSSSLNVSSISTSNNSISRKNTRNNKKTSITSPRKQLKTNRNKTSNNSNSNNILVGRKRSIEDMDSTQKQNSGVDAKAVASRPQLRASKRLHRSSAATEPAASSGLNTTK